MWRVKNSDKTNHDQIWSADHCRWPPGATAPFRNPLCCHRVIMINLHKTWCGLSWLMHDDLHWLVIPQWVQYKLAVTVHHCLCHRAPWYLADYCVPVSEVPGRQHLRSARCHQLSVPRVHHSNFATREFSVAWTNSLECTSAGSSCWLQTIYVGPKDVSVCKTFEALAH